MENKELKCIEEIEGVISKYGFKFEKNEVTL